MNDIKNNSTQRKLKKVITVILFILAYTFLISLGLNCALHVLSAAVGGSLDSGSARLQYPRFVPFCYVVGFLCFIAFIFLLFLNYKASEKIKFSATLLVFQFIISFAISLPLIDLWGEFFSYLQKIF